jgi:lipase chaperone LimK
MSLRFRWPVLLLSITGASALLLVLLLWIKPASAPLPLAAPSAPEAAHVAPIAQKTLPRAALSSLVDAQETQRLPPAEFFAVLPGTLVDTPPPAPLAMDAQGNLVLDMRLRRLFEHYLMAIGEESLEHIVLRIQHALSAQLVEPALAQANALLESYLQYRNHLGELNNQYTQQAGAAGTSVDAWYALKRAARESRSAFFSSEASQAFFAREDAYDDYMLARARVLSDSALDAVARREQLQLIDLDTAPELVRSQQEATAISRVAQQVAQLRATGADESAVYRYREQTLGPAAAQRLAALDEQRSGWQDRLASYREQLAMIEASTQYPEVERERMIAQLRSALFTEREILRVAALDRQRQGSAAP